MVLRTGFVTCVRLGLECMNAIYEAGGQLDLAVTLFDRLSPLKSGRVWLDDFTSERQIPLVKVRNINDADAVEALTKANLDWLFIIGWSQIADARLLGLPKKGVLGIHPTLLPEGRGRASIPWAILKGLQRTGVTLFQLAETVDAGPVVSQLEIPIDLERETASTLYAKVSAAHRALIANAWPELASGEVRAVPQDETRATYWSARTPKDGAILPSMSVMDAERLVRAVSRPYPGAFWDLADGRRLRVWAAGLSPRAGSVGSVPIQLADGLLWAYESEWE